MRSVTRRFGRRESGKTLVPLLGVLAALAMGVAGVAVVLQFKERELRQAKERELQQAQAENQELQARIQETQQAKARVEQELGHAKKELADATDQLTKAVEAQTTLTRQVEDREREIGRLTKDLSQAREQADQLGSQISQFQSDRDSLKRQVAELEQAKGELASKVMELSGQPTVQLDKVVVKQGETLPRPMSLSSSDTPRGGTDGQVVVVNREYDFIVMNLGRNHGLSVGQEFQIVRNDQVLGRVKVEKVYDELSAAAILPESQKDNIREGDSVRAL